MNSGIFKYLVFGVVAGLISWLPFICTTSLGWTQRTGSIVLLLGLPGVLCGVLLYFLLIKEKLDFRYPESGVMLFAVLFSLISWLTAGSVKVGVGFDVTYFDNIGWVFLVGLLPSMGGMLVMALYIKAVVKSGYTNRTMLIFVLASSIGAMILFIVLLLSVEAPLKWLVSSILSPGSPGDMTRHLIFFVSWNIAFYSGLKLLVMNKADNESWGQ